MVFEQVTLDITLIEVGKQADIQVIIEVLIEQGVPLTLDNARQVLAIGLRNKPAAWTITAEELPGLWAEIAV